MPSPYVRPKNPELLTSISPSSQFTRDSESNITSDRLDLWPYAETTKVTFACQPQSNAEFARLKVHLIRRNALNLIIFRRNFVKFDEIRVHNNASIVSV